MAETRDRHEQALKAQRDVQQRALVEAQARTDAASLARVEQLNGALTAARTEARSERRKLEQEMAQIKERNASVVDTIVSRIRRFPDAKVEIVGHTDNIGKDDYNLKLSKRRAQAVYDQITEVLGASPQATITQVGMGPFDPLYGNGLPENRALNRTVTVTLEYEQKD